MRRNHFQQLCSGNGQKCHILRKQISIIARQNLPNLRDVSELASHPS
jgi:hypothetical protein